MTLIEAIKLIEAKRDDLCDTANYFEKIFPGAVSAYRTDIAAYTVAVIAIEKMIEENGEGYVID